ncbi:MAG: hypothetical protein RL348_1111 [Bacteroidota bacterium]|jgi:hypothetical protein
MLAEMVPAIGQIVQVLGDWTYGGISGDGASNIINDGNYVYLIGTSGSGINGNKTAPICNPALSSPSDQDIWLLKLDLSLNIIWQVRISGNYSDRDATIQFNNDSTLIYFSCESKSDISCEKSENNRNYPQYNEYDYWIGAVDLNGNILWDKTLGGNNVENSGRMIPLSSGALMVIGTSNSDSSGDKSVNNYSIWQDVWIVKTDSIGGKIWDKVYGGTGRDYSDLQHGNVIALPNNEILISCYTTSDQSGTISEPNYGIGDIWVSRIDSSGMILWENRYGGNKEDYGFDLITTNDGGFAIVGSTGSDAGFDVTDTCRGLSDVWLLKLDSIGNKIWDKRYGGNSHDQGLQVEQFYDGGYLIGGTTKSNQGLDVSEPPYGITDYWLIRTDSSGNKIWDRRFGGNGGNNYFTSFTVLPDTSILLAGSSDSTISSVKTNAGFGSYDYWLIRIKELDTSVNVIYVNELFDKISIYPNPSSGIIRFVGLNDQIAYNIQIKDMAGKEVFSRLIFGNESINVDLLESGSYICKFYDKKGLVGVSKLLKY